MWGMWQRKLLKIKKEKYFKVVSWQSLYHPNIHMSYIPFSFKLKWIQILDSLIRIIFQYLIVLLCTNKEGLKCAKATVFFIHSIPAINFAITSSPLNSDYCSFNYDFLRLDPLEYISRIVYILVGFYSGRFPVMYRTDTFHIRRLGHKTL